MSIQIEQGKVYVSRNNELWQNPQPHDNLWLIEGPDGTRRIFENDGRLFGLGDTAASSHDLLREYDATPKRRSDDLAGALDESLVLSQRAAEICESKSAHRPSPIVKPEPDIKRHLADEAVRLIGGDRARDYGSAEENFARIARFFTAYFKNTGRDIEVTAADVAPLMVLMKMARLAETPGHRDSYVDIVGYALLGAEINGVGKIV